MPRKKSLEWGFEKVLYKRIDWVYSKAEQTL